MKEVNILNNALQNFSILSGATIKNLGGLKQRDDGYDEWIEIELDNKREKFLIEVKNELRVSNYWFHETSEKHKPLQTLLISQYIPKPLKDELKKRAINYLEATGNCFIRTPDLFIYINDQPVKITRIPTEGKLWKGTGLKFTFVMLQNPEICNKSYREMASETGVSLGSIGGLLEELVNEGFLKKSSHNKESNYFIENKNHLIEQWSQGYRANLRTKQRLGFFRFINKNNYKYWEGLKLIGTSWGGENAGALMTNFLQPEKFTLYTQLKKMELMKAMQLVPDSTGNVEVLEQFWPGHNKENIENKTVPPLLAYADLITSYDSRNFETAQRIKSQYLD